MKTLFLPLLLLSAIVSTAQTSVSGSFVHGGITRTYDVYVPAIYNGSQAVPLVFNLHGYTSNAAQQAIYGNFKPIADTANFILVHPNGSIQPGTTNTQFWNVGQVGSTVDDVDFLETLIDTISAHYNIKQSRIYSAGMSNGGIMVYLLACQSNRFTAIASVTGTMSLPMYTGCNPTRPIPTMEIHGTADNTVPYNGSALLQAIPDVVSLWVTKNNCNPVPDSTNVPNINTTDGATAVHYLYTGGTGGNTVEHYKVVGGGHSWPGAPVVIDVTCMDFNASKEIWRFFSQYENTVAGIEENATPNWNLWPNPAANQIFIQTTADKPVQQLTIRDVLGRTVLQYAGNNITSADITTLKPGNYLVEIRGKDFTAVKKLVVR